MTTLAERLAAVAADLTTDKQAANLAARLAAAVEDTPDMPADQLAEKLSAAVNGEVEAALTAQYGPGWHLVSEAAKLQQQAYAKLRDADAQAQRAQLAAVIPPAEQARQAAESEAESLAELDRVALGSVRQAEDRHREAAEHYRECAQAADDAEAIGDTPAIQTETLLARNAAAEVVNRFAARLDQARQWHARDVERVAAARDLVKALKVAEQAARDALTEAEQHPERAPRSMSTLSVGMASATSEFKSLTDSERATLRSLIADLAQATGADRAARAESRKAGYDAGLKDGRDEARRNMATMPQPGMQQVLPPGVGRR